MVRAIWGTGKIATDYMERYSPGVEFFLDNDVNKKGELFFGKRIVHPDEIEDWTDIYIIVGIKKIDSIKEQLDGYGLQSGKDYSMYYDNIPAYDFRNAEKEIDEFVSRIQDHNLQDSVIYLGSGIQEEKAFMSEYFYQWKKIYTHKNFLFLLETKNTVKIEKSIEERTWMIPSMFSESLHSHKKGAANIEEEIVKHVESHQELCNAAKIFRRRHKTAQPFHEHGVVYYYYLFINKVIEAVHPKCIIIWNQFTAYHVVAKYVCSMKNIPVVYAEYGVLPGTIAYETMGQMGESAPTIYPEEFLKLPVSAAEYQRAGEIWAYIRDNDLNRKKQLGGDELEQVKSKIDPTKPIVFYAGQNDAVAGIYPYTEKSRKFHSPIFESSVAAAKYIAEIADIHNWNFICKPHPFFAVSQEEKETLPSNIIWADNVGVNYLIDLSDVVVTIASQTAYMAMLRDKPVMCIGYLQCKDKGCAYQAFERADIEKVLTEAVQIGFTKEQREAFQVHIAQLVKYYLYDDYNENRPFRYGKGHPSSLEEIESLEIKIRNGKDERE